MNKPIVFVWDNYGPMHIDRCQAVANRFLGQRDVIAIELFDKSDTYEWIVDGKPEFKKITLFPNIGAASPVAVFLALIRTINLTGRGYYFLCHYDRGYILILAWLLRITGSRVFTMNCSKFDDLPRSAFREFFKKFFILPYSGAIASGVRSKDYYRFLGIPVDRIVGEYNTLSLARIRSAVSKQLEELPFERRAFVAVARFVPKKNLSMLIDAYEIYRSRAKIVRELVLCGGGPLESELRAQIKRLGLERHVRISGFVQSDEISTILSNGVALILPSKEEQFGNVVIEALAMRLPIILSDNCGARDSLVRTGVNGFVVEPDNPEGLARFMCLLSDDEDLWGQFSHNSAQLASRGDVSEFVSGVNDLLALNGAV